MTTFDCPECGILYLLPKEQTEHAKWCSQREEE